MDKKALLQTVKGRLIVSCQALLGEPLYDEERSLMPYMAEAARRAGSPMIRANSVRDILAIKEKTSLPVIGIIKQEYDGYDSYITPTMKEVDALAEAGAEVIALDCTDRIRGDGLTAQEYLGLVRERYPDQILMADISTYEEGVAAARSGADIVSTTMSGYTPYSKQIEGPDLELVKRLSMDLSIPVFAEGRIHTPEEACRALDAGAWAVIVGGAITRPLEIAERFVHRIQEHNKNGK